MERPSTEDGFICLRCRSTFPRNFVVHRLRLPAPDRSNVFSSFLTGKLSLQNATRQVAKQSDNVVDKDNTRCGRLGPTDHDYCIKRFSPLRAHVEVQRTFSSAV